MINRRKILKLCTYSPALAALSTLLPNNNLSRDVDAMLIDQRFVQDISINQDNLILLHCRDDVTQVWYDELDQRWRSPGFILEGITGNDSLFVLERLAWDRGRRVTFKQSIEQPHGNQLIHWRIEPTHPSVRLTV